MVTRLNVELRKLIAFRFLAVMFAKAKEALAHAEHELARDVFGHFMGNVHQEILSTIPDEWLPESNGIDVCTEGRGRSLRVYLDYGTPRRVPAFLSEDIVRVKDKELVRRIRAYIKMRIKHDARFHETKSILMSFLGTIPNTKRLVQSWPEIKPVVDEIEAEEKARLANRAPTPFGRSALPFTPGKARSCVPPRLKRVKLP